MMEVTNKRKLRNSLQNIILISGQIYFQNQDHRYMAAGDVKSLLSISFTLRDLLGVEKVNHRFSNAIIPDQDLRRNNVVTVGGPKFNFVTRIMLEKYNTNIPNFPIEFNSNRIIISRIHNGRLLIDEIERKKSGNEVIQDFGVLIRGRNPFNPNYSAWLVTGSGNNGVFAASEQFSQLSEHQQFFNTKGMDITISDVSFYKGEYVSSQPILYATHDKNWIFRQLKHPLSTTDVVDEEFQYKDDKKSEKIFYNLSIPLSKKDSHIIDKISLQYGLSSTEYLQKTIEIELEHLKRHLL